MRLVNVEELKTKLGMEGKEVIGYSELLRACESNIGLARTKHESVAFARVLDEAGVIWLFRDKVYLHPKKIVDEIRRAVPLALLPEDDPTKDELKNLQEKKDKIDELAHKQVLPFCAVEWGLAFYRLVSSSALPSGSSLGM